MPLLFPTSWSTALLFKKTTLISILLGVSCVVKLYKEHFKHVFLYWFSTYNIIFVDKNPLTASNNV